MPLIRSMAAVILATAGFAPAAMAQASAEGVEFFEKRVRPLLAQRCFVCHGDRLQQAGLALNSPEAIRAGGENGPVIAPGDAENSRLAHAVRYTDPLMSMPPAGKLPEGEIQLLLDWIEMGAPMPDSDPPDAGPTETGLDHWSFQPLQAPSIPEVKNAAWPKTPVDNFLLSGLEAEGLSPAPPADKYALLRRVTYDLTGLPPTPAEIKEFIQDDSPDAYETVVNRLLDSPRYGERWGRHWLDLVRYAETDGHEFDRDKPHVWRYRDYVIRAFNDDVPYGRFVKEHIAGDQLPEPRVNPETGLNESPAGTGFFWLLDVVNSPVDPHKAHADRLENQVDVFGKAFMGLTLACARCHDHKFDPVSAKDYYALAGIFQSSRVHAASLEAPETKTLRRRIANEISRIDAAIAELAAAPSVRQTAETLMLTRNLIRESQTPAALEANRDILFEDFESGTYNRWTVEGEAFHDSPPHSRDIFRRQPVDNWRGRRLADSLHNSSDEYTGRLVSRPFAIERNYIDLLVGGGADPETTAARLLIDGEVVETASGANSETLREVRWDVRGYWGNEAVLEIVDEGTGSWGHILADHIVFTNGGEPSHAAVLEAANENGLSREGAERWLRAVWDARDDAASPLHPWAVLSLLEDDDPAAFGERAERLLRELEEKANAPAAADDGRYEDYLADVPFPEWIASGPAFENAFTANPVNAFERSRGNPLGGDRGIGYINSGRISPRFEGSIVSPLFISKKRYVHIRMAGTGRANLVSDEYRAREQSPQSRTEFRWHTYDILMYENKRNYIELIDNDPEGALVVDEIVFSDDRSPPERPSRAGPTREIIGMLRGMENLNAHEFANIYQRTFEDALRAWLVDPSGGGARLGEWLASARSPVVGWSRLEGLASHAGRERLYALLDARKALEEHIPPAVFALAMTDANPGDMPLHIRGDHQSPGETVPRGFVELFAGAGQPPIRSGSGRLQLAERMFETAAPLLARVMANRIWQHHFGRGLVRTPDNFGINGQPPTHPELLDWLAGEFIRSGWSVKAMHRLMLLSSAFRMSHMADAAAMESDPQNRLVHHIPVRRLEAESIRDAMLAVSGRLDTTMFGPGVPPYLTPHMDGRGRPSESGPLDGDGRRSVYLNIRRNFMNPMFVAFDYPPPISAIGRRGSSAVPAQALAMLNNEFVHQQAAVWADRLLEEGPAGPRERVRLMYLQAFGRPPGDGELAAVAKYLEDEAGRRDGMDDPALWRALCHTMFNVTEFIFLN